MRILVFSFKILDSVIYSYVCHLPIARQSRRYCYSKPLFTSKIRNIIGQTKILVISSDYRKVKLVLPTPQISINQVDTIANT